MEILIFIYFTRDSDLVSSLLFARLQAFSESLGNNSMQLLCAIRPFHLCYIRMVEFLHK